MPLVRGFCEICKKQRARNEIALISAKTVKRRKGVDYRTRGTYICTDCITCNADLLDARNMEKLFYDILDKE